MRVRSPRVSKGSSPIQPLPTVGLLHRRHLLTNARLRTNIAW
jgi:hypothetical protein